MMSTMEPTVRAGSGAMFDRIAGRYDLLNRLMSLGLDQRWRRQLVDATTKSAPAGELLDLATGTGDVAILAARSKGRTVVGLDPSAQMLAEAKEKIGPLAISLTQGDAEKLPFEGARFAAVTMSFGIRNVADRPRALAEMARVLVPGGRVGILELGEPNSAIARFHVHNIVPRLGAWLSNDAEYAYLARSIAAFPPPDEFAATMRAAGFVDVEARPLSFGALHLYTGTKR